METRHIKIDYEEALIAKKQLLSSELNILQTVRRLKNYKILRKNELIQKNRLKTSLSSLKFKINLLQSTFPKGEGKPKLGKRKKMKEREKSDISKELEEIEYRLSKLK